MSEIGDGFTVEEVKKATGCELKVSNSCLFGFLDSFLSGFRLALSNLSWSFLFSCLGKMNNSTRST